MKNKEAVLTIYENLKNDLYVEKPTAHQQQLLASAYLLCYQIALETHKQDKSYGKILAKTLKQTKAIIKSPNNKETLEEYRKLIDETPYGQQNTFKIKAGADIRTVGAIAGVILFVFGCVLMSPIVTPVLAVVALTVMLWSGLIGDFVESLGKETDLKKAMRNFYQCAKSPKLCNELKLFSDNLSYDIPFEQALPPTQTEAKAF